MNKDFILQKLDEIASSLSNEEGALALLAVGSCGADTQRMDEYSDLDFFVVCKEGYKDRFMNNLDYIERVSHITYKFRYNADSWKLFCADGFLIEPAVCELSELESIPFSDGRIVWKADGVDESICVSKTPPEQRAVDTEWAVGEILTNIYVGLGRWHRGEKLSAYTYIQGYAKDRVLELIPLLYQPANVSKDAFTTDRRFELLYPQAAYILQKMLPGYDKVVESAEFLLKFLCEHFEVNEAMKQSINELLDQNK